ncbi:hypothetical protein [uncultured Pseudomonas sp.]|uniref:hypothetical protein n=1 Tax=uncultured Pseudomonas sp. TaxID=114707 RepID=UPI0025891A90|nr:hypothetical protein [uncultured Pseudomonas sp.]
MSYSDGKWIAYGYAKPRQVLGYIDGDEFLRDGAGVPIFRIDGEELYDLKGRYRGTIDDFGNATNLTGDRIFTLEPG